MGLMRGNRIVTRPDPGGTPTPPLRGTPESGWCENQDALLGGHAGVGLISRNPIVTHSTQEGIGDHCSVVRREHASPLLGGDLGVGLRSSDTSLLVLIFMEFAS